MSEHCHTSDRDPHKGQPPGARGHMAHGGEVFFWELATLIDIMLLGHWIEMKSVLGASAALESLVRLMPAEAHLVTADGSTREVPVTELKRGDRVLIKPGEKIPTDGTIVQGQTSVNEAMLTGESKPVEKGEGATVIGGAVNGEAAITAEVQKTGDETYLSQVIAMVRQAQESRSRSQDLANRAAVWLTAIALGGGAVTLVTWLAIGAAFPFALARAVTVMVIACPHALGLAVPLVVAVSTALSAGNGLLIRDRSAFERARALDAIVFDKTGTLTEGRFGVTDVISLGERSEDDLLRLAASLESQSEHPIAAGIVHGAQGRAVQFPSPTEFRAIPGKGAEAVVEGIRVKVVSPGYLKTEGLTADHPRVREVAEQGKTVVYVVVEDRLEGAIALADIIRPESREALARLKTMGIKAMMLTGDATAVAQRAGRAELDEEALPPNVSEFDIALRYGKRDPEKLLAAIREDLEKVPGVATVLGQFISHRLDEVLSGIRAQIAIKIYGPDLAVLRARGQQVEQILRGTRGVTDLLLEPLIDVPGVRIKVNREEASRLGLDVGDVLETTEVAFGGTAVSRVVEGQRAFDLFVWFDEASRKDRASMRNLLIDAPEGRKIPLRLVADVEVTNSPFMINREKVQRRIVVQANVAGRDLGSVIQDIQGNVTKEVQLPTGYFIEYGGQFESQQEATRVLMLYGLLAIVGIFVMLYKAFNSSRAALLVMANLPLALIGGVVAIFFTGKVMSVPSLIGLISVFGIAARNGIILVSHYRQLRAEGEIKERVIVEGSKNRLAPVLMTAAAAALGLLPLLFGDPTGKELERPMAQVILGGLFTSTLLNMIVVPTLFMKFGWEPDETFHEQLALERGELFGPGTPTPVAPGSNPGGRSQGHPM